MKKLVMKDVDVLKNHLTMLKVLIELGEDVGVEQLIDLIDKELKFCMPSFKRALTFKTTHPSAFLQERRHLVTTFVDTLLQQQQLKNF